MKYVEKLPNSDQKRYEKMIRKLDPEINLNSVVVRVPNTSELEHEYEDALSSAPNNFERRKIEMEFQLKKIVWQKLGQIQFGTNSLGFENPIYFETVPHASPKGTIIEGTLNTVVNKTTAFPVFIGRIFDKGRGYFLYFVSRGVGLKEDLFEGVFNQVKYRNGEFSVAQLISELKFNLGPKFIEMEACQAYEEPFKNELMETIIMDEKVVNYLAAFHYLSEKQFEPIDLPKNILRFGFIKTECVGCILPTPENNILIQFGDFNVITKSPLFLLLKRVVSIMHTFTYM